MELSGRIGPDLVVRDAHVAHPLDAQVVHLEIHLRKLALVESCT